MRVPATITTFSLPLYSNSFFFYFNATTIPRDGMRRERTEFSLANRGRRHSQMRYLNDCLIEHTFGRFISLAFPQFALHTPLPSCIYTHTLAQTHTHTRRELLFNTSRIPFRSRRWEKDIATQILRCYGSILFHQKSVFFLFSLLRE